MRQYSYFLVLIAGLAATMALAAPPPARKVESGNANRAQVNPKVSLPKNDPPKEVKPLVLPKIDLPMNDKKVDLPRFDKKIDQSKQDKKIDPKFEIKTQVIEPKGKLVGLPGLKLAGDQKFEAADLAKLKPVLDAKKLQPGDLGKLKPPQDFAPKQIGLDKLKIPDNAPVIDKLNANLVLNKNGFILNKNFCATGDYHLKCGKKFGNAWCFPGIHHCHWHHCIWDPYYGCNYFYCPSTCCYYYWSGLDACYYPCWWFVDYGNCYYPWWLCGDFGMHIHGHGFNLHIGW